MSRVNGDKARYNRERKKNIARREGIRQLLQAAGEKATAGKKAAPAKKASRKNAAAGASAAPVAAGDAATL